MVDYKINQNKVKAEIVKIQKEISSFIIISYTDNHSTNIKLERQRQ